MTQSVTTLTKPTIFYVHDKRTRYQQVHKRKRDNSKSICRAHHGHHQFMQMPFDLQNEVSTLLNIRGCGAPNQNGKRIWYIFLIRLFYPRDSANTKPTWSECWTYFEMEEQLQDRKSYFITNTVHQLWLVHRSRIWEAALRTSVVIGYNINLQINKTFFDHRAR